MGVAVFIDGARPDVQAAFPNYPMNSRGGWGFMVLTNMRARLSGGNGTYRFFMYAQDREGQTILLGTRTMTCANANGDAAVRGDRHADAGRRGVGNQLREFRLGADAGREDSSRPMARRSRCWWMASRWERSTITTSGRTSPALFPGLDE